VKRLVVGLAILSAFLGPASAQAEENVEVSIAPSKDGAFGAWLVAGPWKAQRPALDVAPIGIDETVLSGSQGASLGGERDLGGKQRKPPAKWVLASSGEGAIDLKTALGTKDTDVVGYAFGILHVAKAGKYLLMLGVDDGVRVTVDGRNVFSRDEARPVREDDDVIPLDLSEGDHKIVLKLHQRDGAWAFRARLVDHALEPAAGSWLSLPGTTKDDAKTLATKMSWVSLDRSFDSSVDPPRYRPRVTVRFPEGAPRGVPLSVTSRLENGFEVSAGAVPITAAGVGELVVALPPVTTSTASPSLETNVAGRVVKHVIALRPISEQALRRLDRALGGAEPDPSTAHLILRMKHFLAKGDTDLEAQTEEARELDRIAAALEKKVDPWEGRTGIQRRAIVSPFDGEPTDFGLYVPPSYKPGTNRKYPLVVTLHGLNSLPLSMMRAVFGFDEEKKESAWKDRHWVAPPPFDAFVITPNARGNTMYRDIGEEEVMLVTDWVLQSFPIDKTRVSITGPSMGGIGSASIPFHHPHLFAAAAPLCGYHSQMIRRDVAGRPIRPWERFLAEERSNVFWAENGEHLPLYIVHGTKDLPEENSGVLIERYEKLKFSVKHEHPDAGHNVWGVTYDQQKGLKWLVDKKLDLHPAHVRFKTTKTRYGTSAWVTVDELTAPATWADVDARVKDKTHVTATTSGARALTFTRDEVLLDAKAPIEVTVDGQRLAFDEGEALSMHREGASWQKGSNGTNGVRKRARVAGPLRDIFHEPITFVYASEGDAAHANEHVARWLAKVRPGYAIKVSYPILSDVEFLAKNEPLANERALFLVGRGNKVLAALEAAAGAPFPIRIESGAVFVGSEKITGREVGAAFIRPNPLRPDRYVAVLAGADVPGTLRALSLPDILPDFIVWDDAIGPSRGQILLGAGSARAAGFFGMDWSLPSAIADPLAKTVRPGAKSEYDATPYLP
jgi:poly(3-hydroxybutyrate) depolymerase